MGVVADKVIVELEAKLDRYTAEVRGSTRMFETSMSRQEAAAKRAERQIRASSQGISNALRASAAALAAGVSINAVKNLADGYTRYTNQLKVAGLEGSRLADTQEALFAIAQRYGVELEAVGTLYSRATQASKDLGASQSQLLQFTNGVAAGLKVQGGSADQSAGALLQLSQALGGGIIRAEEFNSIMEGARPIAQAAANGIDRYKGSVSKLRTDIAAGKVTSQEFFQGFLKGSKDLEEQAAKANLTIGASLTVLNNALGKYIGEADHSLSATAKLSQAIAALANNLDVIIPALALLATAVGARYVAAGVAYIATMTAQQAATVRAAIAAEALSVANARLVASGGAATASSARVTAAVSGQAVAMGVAATGARAAGGALLAAFGGPIGLAITAVAVALAFAATKAGDADRANQALVDNLGGAKKALDEYEKAAMDAATTTGEAGKAARENAAAMKDEARRAVEAAQALREKTAAAAAAAAQRAREAADAAMPKGPMSQANLAYYGGRYAQAEGDATAAEARAKAAAEAATAAQKRFEDIGNTTAAAPPAPAAAKDKKGVARRSAQLVARAEEERLQAELALTEDLKRRRDIQIRQIDAELAAAKNEDNLAVKDGQLTRAAADRAASIRAEAAVSKRSLVEREYQEALTDQAGRRREDIADAEIAELELQSDIASTLRDRRDLEIAILKRKQAEERAALEQELGTGLASGAVTPEEAAARRATLGRRQAAQLGQAQNQPTAAGSDARGIASDIVDQESLTDRTAEMYAEIDRLRQEDLLSEEQAQRAKAEVSYRYNQERLAGAQSFFGTLASLANSENKKLAAIGKAAAIAQATIDGVLAVQKALAAFPPPFNFAMAAAVGAVAAANVASIAGVGGRWAGGNVVGGVEYPVNEKGHLEAFVAPQSGKIVPLGEVKAQPRPMGGGGARQVSMALTIDLRGANGDDTIRRIARDAAATGAAQAYRAAMGSVPERMEQYGRLGS